MAFRPSVSMKRVADMIQQKVAAMPAGVSATEAVTIAETAAKVEGTKTLTQAIADANTTHAAMDGRVAALAARVAVLEARGWFDRVAMSFTTVAVGNVGKTLPVTWPNGQAPSTNITVYPVVTAVSVGLLSTVTATFVPGSVTRTGCQVKVVNSGLATLGTVTVDVIAIENK